MITFRDLPLRSTEGGAVGLVENNDGAPSGAVYEFTSFRSESGIDPCLHDESSQR